MLSDASGFNSSASRSEGSVFSKAEHSVIAAYLIVAVKDSKVLEEKLKFETEDRGCRCSWAQGIISILSNMIVLGIFIKYKELRTPTNAVIINLALTDVGVSSIGYPMSAASDLHGSWKFGHAGCQSYYGFRIIYVDGGCRGYSELMRAMKVYAGLNIFFGMVSIGLLTVVAMDRYLTISCPDGGRRMTSNTYLSMILGAWINGLFWALMPIIGWASYAPDPTGATCTINWRRNDASFVSYTMMVIVVNFLVPLTVMFYCYYHVSRSMRLYTASDCTAHLNRDWAEQADVTKMSVVMILMFLLAWSPYSIVCLWACFGNPKKIPPSMAIIAPLFAKSSTFYNPCIYVAANKKATLELCGSLPACALCLASCGERTVPAPLSAPVSITADMTAQDQESVLCNDLDMNEVPTNFPVDTVKLRIEKAEVRRVPAEAFYYLVELQYLWLTYNSVASLDARSFYNLKRLHELRLDGNALTAFPWASLLDMPHLRTLDLHNNRITSVPNEAGRYLRNLTCLDLSSNRLTTLPPDFLDSWSHLAVTPARRPDVPLKRIVLGLQDNPWFCDCHISKVIELSKVADHVVVLLDPLMVCSGPESLQGILFQRVELEKCLKPSVMMSATKITSALGSNVLLRCDAKGYPTPQLMWTRSDSAPVNYTVIQESPGEGVRCSIISLTSISYKDAGDYRCKAKNLAGTSEAVVTVTVVGVVTTTLSPDTSERSPGEHPEQQHPQPGLGRSTPQSKSWLSPELSSASPYPTPSAALPPSMSPPPPSYSPPVFSAASATTSVKTSISGSTVSTSHQPPQLHPGGKSNAKIEKNGRKFPPLSASKKEELALLDQAAPTETNVTIRDLRVARETGVSVTLTWNSSSSSSSSSSTHRSPL
ncbi:Leucine-rich repeat, immunoglobulin-like domain and transmembrane domain-containing protein 3 [Apodemus speciosus]